MRDDLIYGIHVVLSLLNKSPERIKELHLVESRQDARLLEVSTLAKEQGIRVLWATHKQLDSWTHEATHQGVMAKIKPKKAMAESDLIQLIQDHHNASQKKSVLLLVLDGVQDPHNLGACLRTADAAGVSAVIIPRDRSVGLTPLVHKVASGAAETTPVIEVTNLVRFLEQLKKEGVWLMGASSHTHQSLYQTDLRGSAAIVLGAEGTGLRRLTEECCDVLMQIPMLGSVESLNVSVAAGITLYEAVRQRIHV